MPSGAMMFSTVFTIIHPIRTLAIPFLLRSLSLFSQVQRRAEAAEQQTRSEGNDFEANLCRSTHFHYEYNE